MCAPTLDHVGSSILLVNSVQVVMCVVVVYARSVESWVSVDVKGRSVCGVCDAAPTNRITSERRRERSTRTRRKRQESEVASYPLHKIRRVAGR